ncbi:MAG TPA: leishmanolysin-related zinc metalloendopeptidase [Gemmatimonadales bacterium]|nr:leishmanolysin-related zinc metalloendopeptidase [Gemmatimonadales bacterium]
MKRIAVRLFHFAAVAAGAVLGACGKGGPTQPRVATRLEVIAGSGQSASAGTTLPVKIVVLTSDADGPVGNVTVVATTEAQGGGTASPTTAATGANGQLEITWTLGSKQGAQTLTLTSGTLTPASATATAGTGAASLLVPVSDQVQFTVVTQAVTSVPSVRVTDQFGNPVQGTSVTFETLVAGSVLTGAQAVTAATGLATLGSWTIGPDAVSYQVRARIVDGPAAGQATVFEAHGVPATAVAVAGTGETGNVSTAVAIPPAVRAARPDNSPLPGVPVTFSVTGGGGTIQGPSVVTDVDGIARATGWILGAAPGANQVTATVQGVPPVIFTATGVPGVATSIAAVSPTTQTGFFGNFVTTPPIVLVTDAVGNPVAGAPVTFALLQADGQVVVPNQVSDVLGHATVGGWRLGVGASEGMRATLAGAPPVDFTANASTPPPSTFKLEVRYRTNADGCTGQQLNCLPPTVAQQAAFDQAAARWKQIILSGSAPYPVNEAPSSCVPAMNETVDGLVIFVSLVPIDSVGNILGSSGPCIVRDDHGFQPAVGQMELDVADLDAIQAQGQLNDVILHEMGHVLGFGTMWDFDPSEFGVPIIPIGPDNPPNTLLIGRGTANPVFKGASARAAFFAAIAGAGTFTGIPVPVENQFGPGTRDSHWRESILRTELMTGFISPPGTPNPLSAITIASFRDLGYVVNDAVGDPFTFLASLLGAPAPSFQSGGFQLNEQPMTFPIIVIDRQGRTVARVPRVFK